MAATTGVMHIFCRRLLVSLAAALLFGCSFLGLESGPQKATPPSDSTGQNYRPQDTWDSSAPHIQVTPEHMNFESVAAGKTEEQKITILNTGGSDLEVTGFSAVGSTFYTLTVSDTEYPLGGQHLDVTFIDSIVVLPGDTTSFSISFQPTTEDPANATLVIYSNAPETFPIRENDSGGSAIMITGNKSVSCIAINPSKVSFGGKSVGNMAIVPLEISACGDAPLMIRSIELTAESSPDFGIDLTPLATVPTVEEPTIVPIGSSVTVNVTYIPAEVTPVSEDGQLQLESGSLVVSNNSFESEKVVKISGAGVPVECPTAITKCAEGSEVIPQTILHLFGDESYSGSAIKKYQWTAEQPVGSKSVFVPSDTFPNPTFETNVAGSYVFSLTVVDSENVPSCFPSEYEVVVIPDESIHVELFWDTPADPDETNHGPEAGADLTLHFLHPWAVRALNSIV